MKRLVSRFALSAAGALIYLATISCGGSNTGVSTPSPVGLYVADSNNNRLARARDLTNNLWDYLSEVGSVSFDFVYGVAVDPSDGTIYLTNTYNRVIRLSEFSDVGTATTRGSSGSGVGEFELPKAIGIDANAIYVCDTLNHRIVRIEKDNFASSWQEFGAFGTGTAELNQPFGIFVRSNGQIYIADTLNDRIVRIDSISGTGWTTFGASGSGTGQFLTPTAMSLNQDGTGLLIADTGNNRIVEVDFDFNWMGSIGSSGDGDLQFNGPCGVTVGPEGMIYVVDQLNHRVVRFASMTATGWNQVYGSEGDGGGQFSHPSYMWFHTN